MTPGEMYEQLSAAFDRHHTRRSGSAGELTYVTGEQVVSRLNTVLGFDGWTFRVKEHGVNADADEIWVLGEMVVNSGDMLAPITREQFGSQKINRSRSSGTPNDIGFDLKGAATDCLKKCASLIGVGLYLSSKDEVPAATQPTPIRAPRPTVAPAQVAPDPTIADDDRLSVFVDRRTAIQQSRDLKGLQLAWGDVVRDRKSGLIDDQSLDLLTSAKNERRVALEAVTSAS